MAIDAAERFFLGHLQAIQGKVGWYRNHRFLGRGGNGTAFLVSCTDGKFFGVQLVLKVFHRISSPSRRRAFLEEVGFLRKLSHPTIIAIFDEGEFRGDGKVHPFAVVEYVPRTVRHLLASREIDRLRAVRIAMNCLSALHAIHTSTRPLIHRDIKPENILVGHAVAKLADFGLAKNLDEEEDDPTAALDGTQWPGMPFRYRTPELVSRARGEKSVALSTSSDIYQMGTVLYELLTGYNPQLPPTSITDDIELDRRPISGSQGKHFDRLLGLMLRKKPETRPSAYSCLKSINRIHGEFCKELSAATGEDI